MKFLIVVISDLAKCWLVDDLLENYNKLENPRIKGSNMTDVQIQLQMIWLDKVDASQGSYHAYFNLILEWTDERFTWDKNRYLMH